ncbi:uncharacterized protein FYW61_011697 [Anableps anableps]
MGYCVAFGCTNGGGSGVSFFSFPKDPRRRKIWVDAVRRKDWKPTKHSKLCSDHFEESAFSVPPSLCRSIGFAPKRLQLKEDAAPSIFHRPDSKSAAASGAKTKRKKRKEPLLTEELTSVSEEAPDHLVEDHVTPQSLQPLIWNCFLQLDQGFCSEPPQNQELWNQERICSLTQKEPEHPHIKEKPEPEQMKEEQEGQESPLCKKNPVEPEPQQIKEEPEEPEPQQIKEESEEPEPQQIKEEPEEPAPQQIKEEPEECSISQEQLVLKLETDTLMTFRSKSQFTEVFGGSGDIMTRFEEEVDGQRRLLEINWKPVIRLHRCKLKQLCVYKDEEVRTVWKFCSPEDAELPGTREGQGDQWLGLKQEADAVLVTVDYDDSDPSDDKLQDQDGIKESPGGQRTELSLKKRNHRDKGNPIKTSFLPESRWNDDDFGETSVNICKSSSVWTDEKLCSPSATLMLNEDGSCSSNRWGMDTYLYETTNDQRSHQAQKPYSCSLCDKRFGYSSHLVSHIRIHTGEKPYCCEDCGKCFSRRETLVRHAVTHTETKPYSCTQCGKWFSRTETLRRHIRSHTGEKPFSCSECGKCFSLRGNLMTHKRTHTGEKLYSCSTCGKRFGNRSHLLSHLRTHTGEKPYSCKECGKSFSQSGSLMKHKRTHTGEKPYSCQECGKCFSESGILRKHERTHKGPGGVSGLPFITTGGETMLR